MKNSIFLIAAFLFMRTWASAQCNCKTLTGDLTFDRTLYADTCYLLSGCYTIKANNTLTIQPGTLVYAGDNSMLYVEREAEILANGASNNPIIFTSAQTAGSRTPGYWAGIAIAGEAPSNRFNNEITIVRTCTVGAGGSNPASYSGVFKYVSIHYADIGLSMVGVGTGTELHDIQVSHCNSDGFQFIGGTVDAYNLVSWDAKRRDFYYSFGYTGHQQFLLGYREDEDAHVQGAAGLLSENDATGTAAMPLTKAVISNYTSLGPDFCNNVSLHSDFTHAVHLRGNTATSVYNSVLTNWKLNGLFMEDDATTIANTATDDLNFSYNSFKDNGAGPADSDPVVWTQSCEAAIMDWLDPGMPPASCSETGNEFSPSVLGYTAMNICGSSSPDFSLSGSSTLSAAVFPVSGDLADPFFNNTVTYRGATGSTDFTAGWTEWTPQREYCQPQPMRRSMENTGLELVPNPAHSSTAAVFTITVAGTTAIDVIDPITHKRVHHSEHATGKGRQRISLDLGVLKSGLYLVQVTTATQLLVRQLFLQ